MLIFHSGADRLRWTRTFWKQVRLFCFFLTLCCPGLANAQARFTSNTELYGMGQIEWKHPTTAQYVITNTGDQPLVISGVDPDCACTVAQWTQTPIAPGAKGSISITFDAEALGHFRKSVAIFTNAAPHLIYLYFQGEVVREIKDFTRTHPFQIGQIRLDCNSIDFPDLQLGEHPQLHIGVVNLSGRPYEPILMHLPPYLTAEAQPSVLQEGEKGIITLTLNSERLTGLGLTQTSVYLSRFSGDKVGEENELPFSVVLLPDFSGMSEAEREQAPHLSLSEQAVDVAEQLQHKRRARRDVMLINTGRSPLQIRTLQVSHAAIGVSLKKNLLQPGETTRLRVTVDKKNLGKHRRPLRLLMITNDPMQAKVELEIRTDN